MPSASRSIFLTVLNATLDWLGRRPNTARLAGLTVGLATPSIGPALTLLLPVSLVSLVLLGVLALERAPLKQPELRFIAVKVVFLILVGPALTFGAAQAIGLPDDLVLAVILVAASPTALSAGLQGRAFGVPDRPIVWTSVLAVLATPLVFPAVAIACGLPNLVDPLRVAERAVVFGLVPTLAALLIRHIAPVRVSRLRPVWRAGLSLSLVPFALALGASLGTSLIAMSSGVAAAVLVPAVTLSSLAAIGAAAARHLFGRGAGLAMALTVTSRNGGFALAASVGALTPKAAAAIAVTALATLAAPPLLAILLRLNAAVGRERAVPSLVGAWFALSISVSNLSRHWHPGHVLSGPALLRAASGQNVVRDVPPLGARGATKWSRRLRVG